MLTRLTLLCAFSVALFLLIGCGNSKPQKVTMVPASGWDLSNPPVLSEDELAVFVTLMKAKPEKLQPEFLPIKTPTIPDYVTPQQFLSAQRRHLRARFDIGQQAILFSSHPSWKKLLAEQQVEPEVFASLLLRVSCAVMSEQFSTNIDFSKQLLRIHERINVVVSELATLEASLKQLPHESGRQERLRLQRQLTSLAALELYAAMLNGVPAESRQLIREHSKELVPLLKDWKKTFESVLAAGVEDGVVPVVGERDSVIR
jgi:hypothetical protein